MLLTVLYFAGPGGTGYSTTTQLLEQSMVIRIKNFCHCYFNSTEPKMGNINKIVVPRIQAEWEDVAYALSYEISTVNGIRASGEDPKKCCKRLFIDWLSTDHGVTPKTWSTLIEKLKEVDELATATNEIITELEKLAESNSSSASAL